MNKRQRKKDLKSLKLWAQKTKQGLISLCEIGFFDSVTKKVYAEYHNGKS